MVLNRSKLAFLLFGLCIIGYAWLFVNWKIESDLGWQPFKVCVFKNITNIPCPSCGTTRSIFALLDGRIFDALMLNPFGFIVIIILVLAPVGVLFDVIFNAKTLLTFYRKAEEFLSQKSNAIPLVLLVISNWFWNILKEL
jgi:hypothetical protein